VPDLGGSRASRPRRRLQDLGLQARVVAIPGPGTVRSTQPGAGEPVRKGSTVTLFVF
jgi:beta-lactam-binding protein with PASTA domain